MTTIQITRLNTAALVESACEDGTLTYDDNSCADCGMPVGGYFTLDPDTDGDRPTWSPVTLVDIPSASHCISGEKGEPSRLMLCDDCESTPILRALIETGHTNEVAG